MSNVCQSCERADVEVIETLDDSAESYRLCGNCHRRFLAHSLLPKEWYNLCVIHGSSNNALGDEYYRQEDGVALHPAEEVTDAHLFPSPTLEEELGDLARLLSYILSRNHQHHEGPVSRWYIHEDLVSALRKYSPDDLIPVFAERLSTARSRRIVKTLFHLIGLTLGSAGARFVREYWERFDLSSDFTAIAFAASKCLPLEEAHERVTNVLSRMDAEQRHDAKIVLRWFETELNLDWIEKNAHSPIDDSWGDLAASSKFDWMRARNWLSLGRHLSLVALDALYWCICDPRKSPLPALPSADELISTLQEYLNSDHSPRVREKIAMLLERFPHPDRPSDKES